MPSVKEVDRQNCYPLRSYETILDKKKGVKAPEQSKEFVPLIGKGKLGGLLVRDAASFMVFWFVVLEGCSPPAQFPRNTGIVSSLEEWQNVKVRRRSQKELSALAYIGKTAICVISPRYQLNSFV